MPKTVNVELTGEQVNFVANCVDTHNKTYGYKVAAECLVIISILENAFKPDEEDSAEGK